MSRINPFKDSFKVTNRFSVFEEKEEKEEKKEKEKKEKEEKAGTYNRVNNNFLKPHVRRNEYYIQEVKQEEKTLCSSDFPELFVSKNEDKSQNKTLCFANKLLEKADEEKNEIVEVKTMEEDVKPKVVLHTPIDTLNALCDLYAYQERWGRYWYGDEAYDEMYSIDRFSKHYEMDNNDLDYDDFSNEDEDDDAY